MSPRDLLVACVLAGCNHTADLSLVINVPSAGKQLLQSLSSIATTATRDGVVLASSSSSASTSAVSLSGVSYGPRTVIALVGVDGAGTVSARGQTCPIQFSGAGTKAPLFFSPTNFFAATASPLTDRQQPVALPRSGGAVLVIGGIGAGTSTPVVLGSTELFTPGLATFAASSPSLAIPRYRAQGVVLSGVGSLVTGGLDASGAAVANAELYVEAQDQFLLLNDAQLDPRVDHRAVVLADGRVFVTGGSATDGGPPLATSLLIAVHNDGAFQVSTGPALAEARRAHAAVVAIGVSLSFGGYGAAGLPIDTIEALDLNGAGAGPSAVITHLSSARAEATASLLADGSVLVVGGVGLDGAPLKTAELYNPVSQKTTVYAMADARHGHTATVLADGRVLVVGGASATGPLSTVELFTPGGVGFVTERPLGTPRFDHTAVPLCDGTVLVIGGGAGAELYTAAPI